MSRLAIGSILIAEPFMLDLHFKRSVVLLTDHHPDDGSIGFILNKTLKMSVNELINDFPEFDAKVYYGGPVATDTIHYIHNVGEILDESREIIKGIFWGGDFDKLKFLIENELIKPENIRFYIGYSGWEPGQLIQELKTGSWVIDFGHPNYVFKSKEEILWTKALENKGKNYSIIGQIPDSNNLN